jgi:O-antigen/teichoic acid export membrane protein
MNARVQGNAARRIEWAILVLGLAGIAAIFVPFAYNKSPWGGLPYILNPLVARSEQYPADSWIVSVAMTSLVLVFFIAPVITLTQLSRCVARKVSAVERAILVFALVLVVTGCAGWLGCMVFWTATKEISGPTDVLMFIIATLILIALFITARHASLRRKELRAEICALAAYIGVAVFFAVGLWSDLDMTAAVAGQACVVYAVSLWRRIREAKA